jgi:hypothetical protein
LRGAEPISAGLILDAEVGPPAPQGADIDADGAALA